MAQSKDMWDKLGLLSGGLAGVLVALVGGVFTYTYSERQSAREERLRIQQNRVLEMQTVERFIPLLAGESEPEREAAILAISSLGSPEIATKLIEVFKSAGTQIAGDKIMSSTAAMENVETAGAPSVVGPPARWVYVGLYDRAAGWRTKYFLVPDDMTPEQLAGTVATVGQSDVNVRRTILGDVIDGVARGDRIRLLEVRRFAGSFVWARISN